jgi:dTMP kinase
VDKSFQLSDESAHLLFSANRWELAQVINAKLEEGINIVLDRYVYSGVAYTSAKGLDRQWCLNPDLGLPKPDLTVFLNLEDRESRAGFGEERYEVSDFQKKVELQFRQFFDEENWNTLVVDGKGIAEVESEVWELVQEVLSNELQEIKTF